MLDFIVQQSELGIKSKNDWWGYYGAFILGASNIVNEIYHVNNIKALLSNGNFFNILNYINIHNAAAYGDFYWLNIIPALFGFYYINGIIGDNLFVQFFVYLILKFLILYLLIKNLIQIIKIKNNFNLLYKIIFIFSFIFILILIYNLSFFGLSLSSIFIYLFLFFLSFIKILTFL